MQEHQEIYKKKKRGGGGGGGGGIRPEELKTGEVGKKQGKTRGV